jgi:hypothetical protein
MVGWGILIIIGAIVACYFHTCIRSLGFLLGIIGFDCVWLRGSFHV